MTAKCISTSLSAKDRLLMGASEQLKSVYQLRPEKEYTVLGLTLLVGSRILGSTPIFLVKDEADRCAEAPASLFEIVDGRASQYWRAEKFSNLTLTLWPEEFYEEFFHDQLRDHDPRLVKIFARVADKLKTEFD